MHVYEATKVNAFLKAISVFIGEGNHLVENFIDSRLPEMIPPKLNINKITCSGELLEFINGLTDCAGTENDVYYARNPFTDEAAYLFIDDCEERVLLNIVSVFTEHINEHTNSRG